MAAAILRAAEDCHREYGGSKKRKLPINGVGVHCSLFTMLPFDVLSIVCIHLDAYSMCQAASVSSWLRTVVDHQEPRWKTLAIGQGYVDQSESLGKFNSWKELYRYVYGVLTKPLITANIHIFHTYTQNCYSKSKMRVTRIT